MVRVLVIYYSQTGNTEKIANAVAEGVKKAGADVELSYYVNAEELGKFDAILVGAPTYYHDIPLSIKTLLEEAALKQVNLQGKLAAAFGSYGWSGEAPAGVLEILKNKFGMIVTEQPLLVRYEPNYNVLEACRALGQRVSESLIRQS